MSLNLETLEKSIKALEKSINIYYSYKEDENKDLIETISSGVIQNFEIIYNFYQHSNNIDYKSY